MDSGCCDALYYFLNFSYMQNLLKVAKLSSYTYVYCFYTFQIKFTACFLS